MYEGLDTLSRTPKLSRGRFHNSNTWVLYYMYEGLDTLSRTLKLSRGRLLSEPYL